MSANTMNKLNFQRRAPYRKERIPRDITSIVFYIILLAGSIIMMIPFYWSIIMSFMTASESAKYPMIWIPTQLTSQWVQEVLRNASFGRYYLNSIVVAANVVIISVFTSALGGYIFAKFRFPLKNALFIVVLATMMVPFSVTIIPQYIIVANWFHLQDNVAAMIVPGMVSAFGIFLMRQFISTIPDELLDAARIDGASEFRIFWQIIIPLCRPALSANAIFTFIWVWNDFLWPTLVTSTERSRTLPVGIASFAGTRWMQPNLLSAASLLILLPMVIIYFIFQREFVQGITMTGLKY